MGLHPTDNPAESSASRQPLPTHPRAAGTIKWTHVVSIMFQVEVMARMGVPVRKGFSSPPWSHVLPLHPYSYLLSSCAPYLLWATLGHRGLPAHI